MNTLYFVELLSFYANVHNKRKRFPCVGNDFMENKERKKNSHRIGLMRGDTLTAVTFADSWSVSLLNTLQRESSRQLLAGISKLMSRFDNNVQTFEILVCKVD